MDADQIRQLNPMLTRYLKQFDDCFARRDTRAHFSFHCLVDGDLFLPEDWSDDRDRCRAAGIPDDVVYRR
jgi:hypothetical protein